MLRGSNQFNERHLMKKMGHKNDSLLNQVLKRETEIRYLKIVFILTPKKKKQFRSEEEVK